MNRRHITLALLITLFIDMAVMLAAIIYSENTVDVTGFWVDLISNFASTIFFALLLILTLYAMKSTKRDSAGEAKRKRIGKILVILLAIPLFFGTFAIFGYNTYLYLQDIPSLSEPETIHLDDVIVTRKRRRRRTFYHLVGSSDGVEYDFSVNSDVFEEWDDLRSNPTTTPYDVDVSYLPNSHHVMELQF